MKLEKAYQTNIVLAIGFLILGLVFKINYLLYLPLIVLVMSAMSETLAKWIAKSWMFLGEQMGKVSGFIVLSLVFFIFLTPLALLKKTFEGKEAAKNSNWKAQNQSFPKESFSKAW
tara:strand:+ start:742 stop:1089 length:348 start_codon:yes stop_codon:yes gene_type:complete